MEVIGELGHCNGLHLAEIARSDLPVHQVKHAIEVLQHGKDIDRAVRRICCATYVVQKEKEDELYDFFKAKINSKNKDIGKDMRDAMLARLQRYLNTA